MVERHRIDCREWLTALTVAGELLARGIEKPDVSDARLAQLRVMAREVLDEERAAGE